LVGLGCFWTRRVKVGKFFRRVSSYCFFGCERKGTDGTLDMKVVFDSLDGLKA
jgi:hypothetical protein